MTCKYNMVVGSNNSNWKYACIVDSHVLKNMFSMTNVTSASHDARL
jgi:hypothetical protein